MGSETSLVYTGQHSRIVQVAGVPNNDTACAECSPIIPPGCRIQPSILKAPTERIAFWGIDQYLIVALESNGEVSSLFANGDSIDTTEFFPNIVLSGTPVAYDEDY